MNCAVCGGLIIDNGYGPACFMCGRIAGAQKEELTMPEERKCQNCKGPITDPKRDKFCQDACMKEWHQNNRRTKDPKKRRQPMNAAPPSDPPDLTIRLKTKAELSLKKQILDVLWKKHDEIETTIGVIEGMEI